MRFYTGQHQHYCGVDLHARTMYLCILNQKGDKLLHQNLATEPAAFLAAIEPFREDLIVGVECMFAWYWLADLCAGEGIAFVLGHALYMKAVHGGKSKTDRIDAEKIVRLLRGGTFPVAYVYPAAMRATRDLLRRRMYLVRKRAELLAHIRLTNIQYNLPPIEKRLDRKSNRLDLAKRFPKGSVQHLIETDLAVIDALNPVIKQLEAHILKQAKRHDPKTLYLLQSIHGVGPILGLTLLYEIHTIDRFAQVGPFLSYSRLVKGQQASAGKLKGSKGGKMGNAYLKWAFSEATSLLLRDLPPVHKQLQRLTQKYGKDKARARLHQKLGRTVYYMLKKEQLFDVERFLR